MRLGGIHNFILAALLGLPALGSATDVQSISELNEAQKLVFIEDHLQGVPEGSRLDYSFKSATQDSDSFSDKVEVRVMKVVSDHKRDLEFNFLSGENHIDFTPAKGYTGNPVIIHFLERDILLMARNTGGYNGFFRNRIRDSFKNPAEVREVKVPYHDREVVGTEIIVTPFVADPFADNFKLYENKRYEFIFSDQVPGGLYRIHTQVPGDNGKDVLIDEDLTLVDMTSE